MCVVCLVLGSCCHQLSILPTMQHALHPQSAFICGEEHMRGGRGQTPGEVVVYEPLTLWGSVGGNVSVIKGGKLYVRGAVYGNMDVQDGGRVHILGIVSGDLTVQKGAKVIVSGQ